MTRNTIPALIAGAAALLVASNAMADDEKAKGKGMVYELRTYHTNPGKLDDLHKRFKDVTNRMFEKHGMTIVGYWTPLDEKDGKGDTLVYMLAFPDRDAAKASWKAFGEDPEWRKAFEESHKNGVLVNKVDSVFLDPTDYSPTVAPPAKPDSSAAPRVFELRTYTASPGKLDDLNKRFREHTMALFKKHGMTSVGYWTPQDEEKGRGNTLVYLLAFPDRDSAKSSWKAFREDPEWQAVAKASEADGVKLAAKVVSVYLEPTDYSPIR